MKILHTSDWHAGKAWKDRSRLDELGAVLDDLASAVERERIDLVLMTGDVFDSPSPPAEAERLSGRGLLVRPVKWSYSTNRWPLELNTKGTLCRSR